MLWVSLFLQSIIFVSLLQVISSYDEFMSMIEKLNIASDQHLVETVQKRLVNPTCSIPAYMDSTLTVRHKDCLILLFDSQTQCCVCHNYSSNLRAMYNNV